jgi:hypothetical protein
MAFARLFPINATDARDGDRTFSERLGLSDDASRALQLIAAEPVHEGPEILASVGTHLEAGFRLPNKHEHLDDLSLNPAATNAPEAQLLNSLLLPPEYNHSVRGVLQKERSSHRKTAIRFLSVGVIAVPFCPTIPPLRASRSAPPSSVMSASISSPNRKRAMRPMSGRTRSTISYWIRAE